ncbi:MAG: NAD-dependent epimerase/dehydratase family protein [Deltaproteobacteria bacterium]|jgi:nucleoside-diphosphate-sugar epimerase|nr:NAD-dependent epimerase/dehydratase family protein [Deltaproteobacteria bacterium]
MKILVTGGGGFLGKAIVKRLLERGDRVRSFSRGDYPELCDLGAEVRSGDLVDKSAVLAAVEGCGAVFHVAAKPGIWGDYSLYFAANARGTRNVIEACLKTRVSKLVYTSSPSVVFGGGSMEGVNESVPYPESYLAHYPKTKAMAERDVLAANSTSLATVALRPHLIWGPGDPNFLPRLIERRKSGRLARVGKNPHLVDCIYIDNAVDAHLLALEKLHPKSPVSGKPYFISQGEPIDIGDLMDRILGAAGLDPIDRAVSEKFAYGAGWLLELIYGTLQLKQEPPMTRFLAKQLSTAHWFDISAARKDLGYTPGISISEGLERLAESLK